MRRALFALATAATVALSAGVAPATAQAQETVQTSSSVGSSNWGSSAIGNSQTSSGYVNELNNAVGSSGSSLGNTILTLITDTLVGLAATFVYGTAVNETL